MGFGVVPRRLSAGVVLAVEGELDVQTAPCLDAAVADALTPEPRGPGTRHLVVDLAGTTFADSSACRALVLAARACAAAGAGFEVVCPVENRPVRRVLTLVGFEALTPLRQSLAETALAAPTQAAPTQAAPTQAAPTQAAPTQAGPTGTGPAGTGPTGTGPTAGSAPRPPGQRDGGDSLGAAYRRGDAGDRVEPDSRSGRRPREQA